MNQSDRIGVLGSGFIGQAWAIVFARGGREVTLSDIDADAVAAARTRIAATLEDFRKAGLVDDPAPILARIACERDMEAAMSSVGYVQECGPEKLEVKRRIFADLERWTAPGTILASSTSGIVASEFAADMQDRSRALVAHPINPPSILPLVEVVPSPDTDPDIVERTMALMSEVGQSPILVRREIEGFILNRLQAGLLNEALRLYRDGYASAADIDRAVCDGLGRRWTFTGPLETMDLNAPGGATDYAARYGGLFERIGTRDDPAPWRDDEIGRLDAELRESRSLEALAGRRDWRDRRLMGLTAHLGTADGDDTD